MVKNKTVIVVGAGASKEVNLPIGTGLQDIISEKLNFRFDDYGESLQNGDRVILEALQSHSRKSTPNIPVESYFDSAQRISRGILNTSSIDNFIDSNRGDQSVELCGKLAIVKSILEAEKNSDLWYDFTKGNQWINYQRDNIKKSWFIEFMKILTENCVVDDLPSRLSNITFIVFNYDRCIEHYLYHALQDIYGIDGGKTIELLRYLDIYHPYGTVGNLEWCGNGESVRFGENVNAYKVLQLAAQIKTFTEGMGDQSKDRAKIHKALTQSKMVLWLGFAYHKINMALLQPESTSFHTEGGVHYGTAYLMSDDSCKAITGKIMSMSEAFLTNVTIRNDLTCQGLFQEYGHRLSIE